MRARRHAHADAYERAHTRMRTHTAHTYTRIYAHMHQRSRVDAYMRTYMRARTPTPAQIRNI